MMYVNNFMPCNLLQYSTLLYEKLPIFDHC